MSNFTIRPIHRDDDAAMAAIIRSVMPEFGATGSGFAISDPEVDWMQRAYAQPLHAYFVLERDGRVLGGAGIAPVSYTHLDVYKRQGQCAGLFGIGRGRGGCRGVRCRWLPLRQGRQRQCGQRRCGVHAAWAWHPHGNCCLLYTSRCV